MPGLIVNIDVPDLAAAERFYCEALGLAVGRRIGDVAVELLGSDVQIYLLRKDEGTPIGPTGEGARDYRRHWTPVHLDFAVDDCDAATARATAAGATVEAPPRDAPYGRIAMLADPFGHGICLIAFNDQGYDVYAA